MNMAKRKIAILGEDDVLRKHARPVVKFDARLHELLDDMAETMYKNNGCGLAAPQVSVLRRAIVMDVGEGLIEVVNPEIVSREGEVDGVEGCLSVPGRQGYVLRPQKVVVRGQDRNGQPIELTCEDWLARCACHEIDHLDGRLYVDIMHEEVFQTDEAEEEES